jgi:muramoyltetrapeptide carboxypeptidase
LLGGTGAALAGAALPLPAQGAGPAPRPLVKPQRLRRGDLVALVASGGLMSDAEIERAVANIESLGLRVKTGANIRLKRGNHAGTLAQQVDDLHNAFRDREVRAVWGGRGGSACSMLLPLLDYGLIRRHPKILVGFSDITALHLAIHRHAGLVTFHGPVGISTFSGYSVAHLEAVLMEARPTLTIERAPENANRAQADPLYRERVFRAGVATGPLIGGNLSVLCALVGTPYAARMKGGIAFFEDIGEAPYRVSRMFTQLVQSGELPAAAGVMLGVFRKCEPPPGEASLTLEEALEDNLWPIQAPSAYGFSFGHIAQHFTIPLGVRARLDTADGTLTLLEPAVS